MPLTKVVIYQEENGRAPLIEWLDRLPTKVQDKCIVRVEMLEQQGHELRRPHCDFLQNGIYELRVSFSRVNYRILYCFAGKNVVLLSHGCTKEKDVPNIEIGRAIRNRNNFVRNPQAHTYVGEL